MIGSNHFQPGYFTPEPIHHQPTGFVIGCVGRSHGYRSRQAQPINGNAPLAAIDFLVGVQTSLFFDKLHNLNQLTVNG